MFKIKFCPFVLAFVYSIVACSPVSLNVNEDDSPVVTLRATFVNQPATKAEFGASTSTGSYSQIFWKEGDEINVFSSDVSAKYSTEKGGETASFVLVSEDVPEGKSFLGLSPYQEEATANLSSKNLNALLPPEQFAEPGLFDPKALLAAGFSSSAEEMSFYNICSGLCFTLSGSQISSYNRIELTGNEKEILSGPINISCSNASVPVVSSKSNGTPTVSLVLPDGASFQKGRPYYLLFLPGEFHKGFTLTFKNAEGEALVTSVCSSYVEFKRSVIAKIDGADIPSKLAAIRDGELLSKNGTANSYIISKAGEYKFPLSRANETEFFSGITSVKVLWETDNTIGTQYAGSIISSVATNGKFVYLKTPDTLKDGNAVIAAYKGEAIIWSWHIWVCNGYNPSASKQKYTGKNAAMMDRNLGALSADPGNSLTNGLFYQWGRKDPFPGAAECYVEKTNGGQMIKTTGKMDTASSEDVNATVQYAIANPFTFITTTKNNGDWLAEPNNGLWAETKTVYDPCPAGWRVPSAYVIDSSKNHVTAQEAWSNLEYYRVGSNGSYGVYLDNRQAWYPNNGYLNLSGSLLMVGQYSCYWSCSPQSLATYAMEMSMTSSQLTFNPLCFGKVRGEGHSIRCVEDK